MLFIWNMLWMASCPLNLFFRQTYKTHITKYTINRLAFKGEGANTFYTLIFGVKVCVQIIMFSNNIYIVIFKHINHLPSNKTITIPFLKKVSVRVDSPQWLLLPWGCGQKSHPTHGLITNSWLDFYWLFWTNVLQCHHIVDGEQRKASIYRATIRQFQKNSSADG